MNTKKEHGKIDWMITLVPLAIVVALCVLFFFAPEFERSGYNSVWTDGETDEWLQTVENGIVTACSRTGGKGGWQLYSISRWTAEDGKKLKHHLEIEFEQKKNRQIYWDDVAMFCYPKEYQLGIRPMNRDDIIEVDNLSELIALDASYKKYVEEK